ncbi:MAG: DUF4831 family protein [Bacteroidota bacterium]
MIRIIQLMLISFLSINTLYAQISSLKVKSTMENLGQNGIFYALPRAVLQVDVVVNKTEELPGPYVSYARQVLGLNDFISKAETYYTIKGISISSSYEADPNAIYFFNFGERSSKTERAYLLQLQANGVIKGLDESSPLNEDYVKARIDLLSENFSRDFSYFADLNQISKIDTIIRRISVDTTTIEDVVFNKTNVEKNMEQRAKDAASFYMEIRKNKFDLLSGYQEVNYPAQTLALMISELKKMESDYLALFKGKRITIEEKYTFYVVPEGDKTRQTYSVFKFSKEKGVADLNAPMGEKVNLIVQSNGMTEVLKTQTKSEQSSGIFYRVPESARVWLSYNNMEYAKNTFLIPQIGVLQAVSTTKNIISIDPKTGMLQVFEIK